MLKLKSISINDLIPYNSNIRRNNHFIMVLSSQASTSGVQTREIVPEYGKYMVSLNINTIYNIYWSGNYFGVKNILLRSGMNKFEISIAKEQLNSFFINITSSDLGYKFIIYSISIVCTSTDKLVCGIPYDKSVGLIRSVTEPRDSVKPIEPIKQSSSIIKPTELVKQSNTTVMSTRLGNKKNILLVADVKNWCFYNTSVVIKKYLENKYNIYIECYADKPNYRKIYGNLQFDLVVKFWYGHQINDVFNIYTKAKKAICIYDYIYWNPSLNKIGLAASTSSLIKNMNDSNYILYSCPMIKKLALQLFNGSTYAPKMFPIYDGYDPSKFYAKEYSNNPKLIVGWVGNTKNIFKRFDLLRNLIRNVDWIEFKAQVKDGFISHDKMVHYYHSIDVIVCLSDAEGTPTPVLEASACGRVWVSTDVGIVRLIMDAADTKVKPGFIINNPSELLDKLKFLHENRDIMREMGSIGGICAKRAFSWDVQIKQFDVIFSK
jgi:glycosyltransferase involved in cell wall biosynthesis